MSWLDLTDVQESSFEVLPAGEYFVSVKEAMVKSTKDNNGEYINITFEVMDDDFQGRKIFSNFNIKNNNKKAQDIGLGQLRKMIRCSGQENFVLNTASDLCGLSMIAKVIVKSDPAHGDKNEIKDFKEPIKLGETTTDCPF